MHQWENKNFSYTFPYPNDDEHPSYKICHIFWINLCIESFCNHNEPSYISYKAYHLTIFVTFSSEDDKNDDLGFHEMGTIWGRNNLMLNSDAHWYTTSFWQMQYYTTIKLLNENGKLILIINMYNLHPTSIYYSNIKY